MDRLDRLDRLYSYTLVLLHSLGLAAEAVAFRFGFADLVSQVLMKVGREGVAQNHPRATPPSANREATMEYQGSDSKWKNILSTEDYQF